MKFALTAFLILCSGFTYDFFLKPKHHIPHPEFSNIWPKVKEFVDTHTLIHRAAKKHGVPFAFVKSIIAAESNFDSTAISPKGAIGLMQLMPATAQAYGADDPTIPEQNIDAGAHYLRVLLDRYSKYHNGLVRAIAAYNAGPSTVDRYKGVPPYPETRGYVARVLAYLQQYQREHHGSADRASLPGQTQSPLSGIHKKYYGKGSEPVG